MNKQLIPNDDIVQSLVNLRDELWTKHSHSNDPDIKEIIWKINSCLYRGYQLDKLETKEIENV